MLAKGDKRFIYCVVYVPYFEKRSCKCEYFTEHIDAMDFCRSLCRSPDLVKFVELYSIGVTVDVVERQYRYEG